MLSMIFSLVLAASQPLVPSYSQPVLALGQVYAVTVLRS